MLKRLPPLVVVALLLVGARAVEAQPSAPQLTPTARALSAYLPAAAELPTGFRQVVPLQETRNEDVVAAPGGIELAPLVRETQRFTEANLIAAQVGRMPAPVLQIAIIAFPDAEAAWRYARDYAFPLFYPRAETLPAPDVGERSLLYQFAFRASTSFDQQFLMFQRDRLAVQVILDAAPGDPVFATLDDVARAVDARIRAAPPPPPTEADRSLVEAPTPTVLVRGAARIMLDSFIEELEPGVVFLDAWRGATQALLRAGVAGVPSAPDYPDGFQDAVTVHMQTFPMLERLAEGRITPAQLVQAALREMTAARGDCHTSYLTPEQSQQSRAQAAGGEQVRIGFSTSKETLDAPLRVVSVATGSPAAAAGMRRGQEILEINGRSVRGLGAADAGNLIDRREGAPNTLLLRNPSGRMETVVVAPARFTEPPIESTILPDNIGLIRLTRFESNTRQVDAVRQALEEFEAAGVRGWLFDLRDNPGGSGVSLIPLISLFSERGRLFGNIRRGDVAGWTEATGNALPFQRPLVFLVGPGSASAGEIMPGVLQARGRAVLVGETTAGCIGSFRSGVGLLDGSELRVTVNEVVLGPDAVRAHRVGVQPNVFARETTPLEEEEGRDPQLDAAVQVLLELTDGAPAPAPQPASPTSAVFMSA
jgi:carboxyl-terminal processing protease